MAEQNAAAVRRWFEEVWNERRAATIDDLIAADSVCYADDGPIRGPAEFRARQWEPFLAAFPDLRVTIDDLIADGDRVAVRWTATGTHAGAGLGFAATGRPVAFRGLTWIRAESGRFVEAWQSSNIPEVFRSLASPG